MQRGTCSGTEYIKENGGGLIANSSFLPGRIIRRGQLFLCFCHTQQKKKRSEEVFVGLLFIIHDRLAHADCNQSDGKGADSQTPAINLPSFCV